MMKVYASLFAATLIAASAMAEKPLTEQTVSEIFSRDDSIRDDSSRDDLQKRLFEKTMETELHKSRGSELQKILSPESETTKTQESLKKTMPETLWENIMAALKTTEEESKKLAQWVFEYGKKTAKEMPAFLESAKDVTWSTWDFLKKKLIAASDAAKKMMHTKDPESAASNTSMALDKGSADNSKSSEESTDSSYLGEEYKDTSYLGEEYKDTSKSSPKMQNLLAVLANEG